MISDKLNPTPAPQPENEKKNNSKKTLIIIGAVCVAILLLAAGWMVYSSQKALQQIQNEKEQMQLDY